MPCIFISGVSYMNKSRIEWTDATWNPVTGCTKISPGCKNCYAETFANRGMGQWKGRKFTDVRCHHERLDWPKKIKKPQRIFVNSMSDLFHDDVPFEFINEVWLAMIGSPKATFQILTKRPKRMKEFFKWENAEIQMPILPKVWLGVSVEDQATADERIPLLLPTPPAVRYVSYEPALGPLNIQGTLNGWHEDHDHGAYSHTMDGECLSCPVQVPHETKIDWLICGGESGPHARPFDLEWAGSVRDQCKIAGVPFFMKDRKS